MAPALPLAVVANVISFVNDMTLSDATRRGDLELVKLLVAVDKSKCTAQHMDTAATYGHLEIVKFLHRASPSGCTAAAMDGAIHYGQLEVVRFLHFNRTEGCTAAARCLLGAQLSGGPAMARFFIQHLPMKMCNCILRHAVAWDDLELVADILHMRPSAEAAKAKEDAINYSRDSSRAISILKLLYEKGEDKTPSRALVHAARRRNSDAIKYLLDQGEGFVREAVGEAVRWDGGEIVQLFLNDARVQLNHTEVTSLVDLAASARFSVESRPAVVEVLRERYPDAVCSPRTFVRAAKQGHLAVVKALYSAVRMETYSEALVKAALYHKHDVVGFLASVCDDAQLQDGGATALFNGNLRIAKYLVSFWRERNGAKSDISDNATDCSPEMLEILDRVYQNGATEDSVNVLAQAAYSGDLGVVAYLAERNIGNPHDAIMEAIRRGHLTIVRYLIECTRVTATRTIAKRKWMPRAACFGHLDVLIYLDENVPGAMCPSIAMDHAAARGYLDVVRFLHTHRTEGCTTHAMDGAAYGNHFEIVRFLHENRTEGCSPRAFEKSAKRGLTEMVKLLLEIVPAKCNVDKGILLARRNGFEETVAALEAFKAKIC